MKSLILIVAIGFLTSCTTTQLVDTWRNPDVAAYNSSKILIVGLTSNKKAREKFERKLKREYEKRGIEAVMSLEVFEASLSTEKTENELKELENRLIEDGFDSILFSKLIGVEDKMAYNSTYRDIDYSYRNFRDDYYKNQDIYFNPEYYIKYKVYHAETSLYCICPVKDRELIWKGYIDILDPESANNTVDDYVALVVYALEEEQLLFKKQTVKAEEVIK